MKTITKQYVTGRKVNNKENVNTYKSFEVGKVYSDIYGDFMVLKAIDMQNTM